MKKFIWLVGSLFVAHLGSAQPLKPHLWKHRVVVLLAPTEQEAVFKQQLALWTAQPEEVTDRDLVLYQIFNHGGLGPGNEPLEATSRAVLIKKYGPLPEDGLKFLLIGKDGGVKLEKEAIVAMPELFARIDQMPMRQTEMRRRKN
ncbi:MAG: DUF4174 domain-containing protein [Phaeodactylibacter sp.]|uniref:DUF4174 domain-containing protein n=1 Tax=Phaeodactylibacter sp. TaxID=1940289 RepID=UPI0032F09823